MKNETKTKISKKHGDRQAADVHVQLYFMTILIKPIPPALLFIIYFVENTHLFELWIIIQNKRIQA